MRSGKEIVLEYCETVETHDINHLHSSIENGRDIKSGEYLEDKYELSSCPSAYGLDEWDGLCFEEEVKGNKAQGEQCRKCWLQALDTEFDR